MKETSTLSYFLNKNAKLKTNKSDQKKIVRDESVKIILAYSKSLKCIKTDSIGDVLLINN